MKSIPFPDDQTANSELAKPSFNSEEEVSGDNDDGMPQDAASDRRGSVDEARKNKP